jgi:hypothetical protein
MPRAFSILTALLLLSASPAWAESTLTKAASAMGREMNRQLADRLGQQETAHSMISVIITTPVDINNFEESNPVARQMQEELSYWFTRAGYRVQEVRRGNALLLRPYTGELLLTRNKELVSAQRIKSSLIMAGTYSVTSRSLIFNIRLIQTDASEVFAMSNIVLPITGEMRSLINSGPTISTDADGRVTIVSSGDYLIEPSVFSRLP